MRFPAYQRATRADRSPSGFTLLEMILVVAIVVAMFGISWPLMERAYGDLKLKESAEKVRLKMGAARIHAIDSGLAYQFRVESEGHRFLFVPYDHATEADLQDSVLEQEDGELPEGLSFQAVSEDATLEKIDEGVLGGFANKSKLAEADWLAPLVFYPDGSATEATFRLVDEEDQCIEISLRELTSRIEVSAVQREKKR
jgi:prepilin-type N-terminal cleavage/methylation domain-containing protein